jgi:hypothetical protein
VENELLKGGVRRAVFLHATAIVLSVAQKAIRELSYPWKKRSRSFVAQISIERRGFKSIASIVARMSATLTQQDFDLLLRTAQGCLTLAGEGHTAFELF